MKGNSTLFAESTERAGLLKRLETAIKGTHPGAAGATLICMISYYAEPEAHRYRGRRIGLCFDFPVWLVSAQLLF